MKRERREKDHTGRKWGKMEPEGLSHSRSWVAYFIYRSLVAMRSMNLLGVDQARGKECRRL